MVNPDGVQEDQSDNPRGYMRMGGYETTKVLQGDQSVVKMLLRNNPYNNEKFKFYLKDDSSANAKTNVLGALSTINLSSLGASAEFQVSLADPGIDGDAAAGRCFGMAYEETKQTLLDYKKKLRTTSGNKFYVTDATTLTIKKIKFFNDNELLKHVEYDDEFRSAYVRNQNRG